MTDESKTKQYHYQAFLDMGMSEEKARFAAAISVGEITGDVIEDIDAVPESQLPDSVRIELDKAK